MSGTTLIRTTLAGMRPLGVRGEPLHHAQAQIRAVVRRRLGDRHYHLLAEPQPHNSGGRIDWYSACTGPVRALPALPEAERDGMRLGIDALLADIERLGRELETAEAEDSRLAGRSLRLAARRPSDDHLFLVGDQPVIVCWGYDTDTAGAVLPPAFIPSALPYIALRAPAPATSGALMSVAPFPWLFWLAAGLLTIAILMLGSWLLRHYLPVPPELHVTRLRPAPAPPPPPPAPDPVVGLQGDIDAARREEDQLRATLASLREELDRRYRLCHPPPPEKSPDQVAAKPGDVLRLPDKPTDDYAFLKGCWRGDQFRYTPRHPLGHHTYCFDAHGNGRLKFRWQNGVTCEAPATARYQDDTLRIIDADTTCSNGTRWTQDRLVCRPGADGVAECSGETSLHLPDQGLTRDRPTPFTVRLRRQ